jgi:hypothetical protein
MCLRRKTKKMVIHIGFWTTVSGFILANFLYNGILQEKIKKDHINE